jgi:hypothetical protein
MIWLWQLPQNVIGFIVSHFLPFDGDAYRHNGKWSVALGEYVIVSRYAPELTIQHEYGHVSQSRLLGPLYLIVVGVPSFIMATLTLCGVLSSERYYDRWPENWADRLGGVDRTGGRLQ